MDLLWVIDMFCRHMTVWNEIGVDDRLEFWSAWTPDDPLKNACFFSLSNLLLGESFRFFFHGRHHCQLAIAGVVTVQSIGAHDKARAGSVWPAHNKGTVVVAAVTSDMELFTHVLEGKDVGDGVCIKPNLSTIEDMNLHIGGQSSTIAVNSHSFVALPCSRDESAALLVS